MHARFKTPRERLFFALDVPDLVQAKRWIDLLAPHVGGFKIGLELYSVAGPKAVELVRNADRPCFLDLKLHDIPHTVARAVQVATTLDVQYLTVHAVGGRDMLRAARESADGSLQILAVTVLTSHDASTLSELGRKEQPEDLVRHLARLAWEAGANGFVSSPAEVTMLRQTCGDQPVLVTPGIRWQQSQSDDQRRTASPEAAIRAGADVLVVGRPIKGASDPTAAAEQIVQAIATGVS